MTSLFDALQRNKFHFLKKHKIVSLFHTRSSLYTETAYSTA